MHQLRLLFTGYFVYFYPLLVGIIEHTRKGYLFPRQGPYYGWRDAPGVDIHGSGYPGVWPCISEKMYATEY